MVLMEHEIHDDRIVIKKSELIGEQERLTDLMVQAKADNDFDSWLYHAGQEKVIKDILSCFQEGKDSIDADRL